MINKLLIAILLSFVLSSCFTKMYKKREKALVENVDIDETIKIAQAEVLKSGWNKSLGIWVLRDQIVTPKQAQVISKLYLAHIDSMKEGFNIWHSSWGISNLYRLGNDSVKMALEKAYQVALVQPERLKGFKKRVATKHISGDELVMGPIHMGGSAYAKDHLVVPGNKKYVQSYEEYLEDEK